MAANKLELIENRRAELQAAFHAFGSVSEQLPGAFYSLRGQVTQLRTELGEAHAGKEHLSARLSALIKGLPGGVLVLDGAGLIRECNPAAARLLGEPLLRQRWTAVLSRAAAAVRAAVNPRATSEQVELRSGKFINVSKSTLASGDEVVLLTDVTESQTMQTLMARQQRLLTMGELAAGLAHQIRTPLAAALLYASQMTLPGRSGEDLERCAAKTVDNLKQLDKLVNDMLAFAHGGAACELVSVSALLEQVAQWLRPALGQGIRLTISTQAPNLMVRANAPSLVSGHQRPAGCGTEARTGIAGAAQCRGTRANRRQRQRAGSAGKDSRADLRTFLHDARPRQRHRPVDRPIGG
jgi:two-component system sensor histidine kinase FlrB